MKKLILMVVAVTFGASVLTGCNAFGPNSGKYHRPKHCTGADMMSDTFMNNHPECHYSNWS